MAQFAPTTNQNIVALPHNEEEPVEAYLGEIRLFAFGMSPRDWAPCAGQLLNISINQALYSLLGTQYGGDGRSNFKLPDLRGRVAMHRQPGTYGQGVPGGEETVTLTQAQVPVHTHSFQAATDNGTQPVASTDKNRLFAKSAVVDGGKTVDGAALYGAPTQQTLVKESPEACGATSDGVGHNNMQPSLVMNYMICINGIYPPRS
ncbi:tail fiber protein [Pandoraea sputorum]|uniref:phage tail protein n=1 Tax=Pandoraea sputorum TaxID=93222 RepID=UPI001E63C22F|nr:tail fiber protein [Pandoraea sputorum]MCE4063423.1 tail fiber protein [Pandoraea sputorum]